MIEYADKTKHDEYHQREEIMSYYVIGTDIRIQGTFEKVTMCYPITRSTDPNGDWEYTGAVSKLYDDDASHQKNDEGEYLFLGDDGEEYPRSEIEWREDVVEDED